MYMTIVACIESNNTLKYIYIFLKVHYCMQNISSFPVLHLVFIKENAHTASSAMAMCYTDALTHLPNPTLCTLNNRCGKNEVPKKPCVLSHTLKDHCTPVLCQPYLLWRWWDRKNEYELCLFTITLFLITSKQKATANSYLNCTETTWLCKEW